MNLLPGAHYFVGGNTKFYGAALVRLRQQDFGELRHHGGVSPAWPLKYDDLEPYYTEAEYLYQVHGVRGEDPTEPPASKPYRFPPVSHEARIQQLSDDLAKAGAPAVSFADRHSSGRTESSEEQVHPLFHMRRISVSGARQSRCAGDLRRAGAGTFQCHASYEEQSHAARHGFFRPRRHQRSGGSRRCAGDVLRRYRGFLCRRRELRGLDASFSQ